MEAVTKAPAGPSLVCMGSDRAKSDTILTFHIVFFILEK